MTPTELPKGALRGRLVILRPKQLSDAQKDYQWRTDPELTELDATRPLNLTLEQYLMGYHQEIQDTAYRRRFGIDTLDGEYIGNCVYFNIDVARRQTEVGILIGDRRYWSHGYGTDAMLTMLRHIFGSTPLRRAYLHTLDWNHRAQASFRKVGFKAIGRVQDGPYRFIVMELMREDFLTRSLRRPDSATPGGDETPPDERG